MSTTSVDAAETIYLDTSNIQNDVDVAGIQNIIITSINSILTHHPQT